MHRRDVLRAIGVALGAGSMPGLTQESYAVFQESPRLLLSEDRLRLLRREVERRNERWRQLELLIQGNARFPEPVFALALAHVASGDAALGRAAAEAIQPSTPTHQVAMAYDFCAQALPANTRQSLLARLRTALAKSLAVNARPDDVRDLTLAAVALADEAPEASARALGWVHQQWWPSIVTEIQAGRIPIPHREALPVVEILFSFQRALQLDLRESALGFFRDYPIWHLLRHYPPSFAGGENDYRVPAYSGDGEPDIDDAARSRAAELANPRFRMRGTLGAPYEFFWCNPYQPSLSYFYLPLYQHLPAFGILLARSSWEENATWLGTVDGRLQLFTEDGIRLVERGRTTRLLAVGPSSIVLEGTNAPVSGASRTDCPECERLFWVGLQPSTVYEVEIDAEEIVEATSSKHGILELDFSNRGGGGVSIRPRGGATAA
ncbi:MAG: hypothetical protein MUF01_18855 [Bryobacterales bacterium]|nr:hypothetical protein [Bryobacterales bacterium]